MKRVFGIFLLVASASFAGGFSFAPQLTPADLEDLGDAMGELLAFPQLTTAAPSGVAGFELMAVAGGLRASSHDRWYRYGVDQGRTLGLLVAPRVVARKGLPWKLDVGAQYGTFAGEVFWGGEVKRSLVEGGAVLPAVSVALSLTRLSGEGVDFWVSDARLVASKGFVVVAPYAGVGWRRQRVEAFFGDPAPRWHKAESDRAEALAGLVEHPLPAVRVVAEARRGAFSSFFVGLGVGL